MLFSQCILPEVISFQCLNEGPTFRILDFFFTVPRSKRTKRCLDSYIALFITEVTFELTTKNILRLINRSLDDFHELSFQKHSFKGPWDGSKTQ